MTGLVKGRRSTAGILLAVMVAAVLGACAGSASEARPATDVGNGAPDRDAVGSTAGEVPAAPADGGVGEPAPGDGSNALAIATGPMVVKTGMLELEVADLDGAILRARAAVVGLGGYVSDSKRTSSGGQALATITYRIPAARWDDALDALGGLATKIVAEDTRAVEVTGEIVDLDARIANLRATEQALQGIMAKANRISDILEVQAQLTTVQGQIEQLTAHRTRLADQATYGTLAVTWTVPLVAIVEATEGWNLGAELDRAFAQLLQVGQGLLVLGVWFAVVLLPILGGIGLVLAIALLLARRFSPTRRPITGPAPSGPSNGG